MSISGPSIHTCKKVQATSYYPSNRNSVTITFFHDVVGGTEDTFDITVFGLDSETANNLFYALNGREQDIERRTT